MATLRTLLASLAILVGGIGALHQATDGFRAFTSETARRMNIRNRPVVVPNVELETSDGTRRDFASLRGRWLLVDLIYTNCTFLCPLQGAEFGRMQRGLTEQIAADKVALLSISFDPEKDEPAALQRYLQAHRVNQAGWVAARPVGAGDLAALLTNLGVIVIPDGMGGFMHNAATLVIDPAGRLVDVLDWDDHTGAIAYINERVDQ